MSTFEQAFNKGVPTDLDIDVTFYDLLNLSTDRDFVANFLANSLGDYNKETSKIIGKATNIYPGNRLIRISTDLETLNKKVTISPYYLDSVIASNLNVNNYYSKMKRGKHLEYGTLEDAKVRLELLKTMKSATQLEKHFPSLYESLKHARKIKRQLEQAKSYSDDIYKELLDFYNISDLELDFFNTCTTAEEFIKYSCLVFEGIINNYDQLKDLYKEKDLGKELFSHMSLDQLELYIASFFLDYAEVSSDIETKQKSMYYVSTYMFEHKDDEEDITFDRLVTNINNKAVVQKVSRKDLYERFKSILINNPELYNINFDSHIFSDMSIDEIEKLMAEYMKSVKLKWEILPDDDSYIIENIIKTSTNGCGTEVKYSSAKRDPAEVFMEKKAFFDSSDPFVKVMGKDTFDGYVGYIYPNGTVILDKFYENVKKKRLAEEHAIYCMKLDDFYLLSQLSKSTIIAGKLCKRFYHRGNWQSRVKKEITGTAKDDVAYKSKLLELINVLK